MPRSERAGRRRSRGPPCARANRGAPSPRPRRPVIATRPGTVNCRPSTAAFWRSRRSSGSSPSSRAAISAWSDSGTSRVSTDPLQPEGAVLPDQDPAVDQHPDRLHGVERDALGAFEDPRPDLVGRARDRVAEQGRHLGLGQRLEEDRREVPRAAPQAGPALRELGPGQRHHEQRAIARPLDEVLDEVQQRAVGPVDVLEHHHGRSLVGDPLEEDPAGREQVLLVAGAALPPAPGGGRGAAARSDARRRPARAPRRKPGAWAAPRRTPRPRGCRPPRTISPSAQNATPSPYARTPALVPPRVVDEPVDVLVELPHQPRLAAIPRRPGPRRGARGCGPRNRGRGP